MNPNKIIYSPWDLTWQFSFLKYFTSQSLDRFGELPLWNPYTFGGNPHIGNLLSAMFYPINILYLIFPTDFVFGYVLLLDIFLAGVFMYFFMRTLDLNRYSSFISAIIFMFSGSLVVRIYAGHINNLDVIIWTPLAFLLLERAIRKNSLFYGMLTGVPIGLQLLASHVQFAIYSFIGLFLYFLLRCLFIFYESRNLKLLKIPIKVFILAFGIGILLSAIQTLPSLELSKHSTRFGGISYDIASSFSLPPQYLTTFFLPEFFGSPIDHTSWGGAVNFIQFTAYVGIVPLILALLAIKFRRNKYTMIFLALIIFTLLYSFGKYAPLYPFFYYIIPGFNMLKEPSLMLFIYSFSVAVLSGFGCDFLFNKTNYKNKGNLYKFAKILFIFAVIILVGISVVAFKKSEIIKFGSEIGKERTFNKLQNGLIDPIVGDFYLKNINEITNKTYLNMLNDVIILFISILLILIIIIFRLKRINFELIKILLILSILFALWSFGMKYVLVKSPNEIYAKTDVVKFLEQDKTMYRVLGLNNTLPQHISGRYGIQIIDGYDPTVLKRYMEVLMIIGGQNYSETYNGLKGIQYPKMLDVLNTKYIITTEKIENENFILKSSLTIQTINHLHQIKYNQTNYIYENKNSLPRAFSVERFKVIDEGKILEEMKSDRFQPQIYAILEEAPETRINGSVSKIEITSYKPNEIVLNVDSSNTSFLVLSEVYYPGWKAYDNGKEIRIYKTNYILRGVFLDDGKHTIRFAYEPVLFKIGMNISIIGWLVLIIIIVLRFV